MRIVAKNRMQVQTMEDRICLKNIRFIDIRRSRSQLTEFRSSTCLQIASINQNPDIALVYEF
jgi:hypothetical protein